MAGSLRAAREWDLPHEVLDAAEIRRRFPTLTPADDEVGLYEDGRRVRPARGDGDGAPRAGRAPRAPSSGSRSRRWSGRPTADGVRVTTAAGHVHRRPPRDLPRRVGAGGAGRPRACRSPSSARSCTGSSRDGGVGPFTPDRHPIWIHGDGELQLYGFPAIDGPDGGVKAAFFRRGEVCTPETIDREVHAGGGRVHRRPPARAAADDARTGCWPRSPACTRRRRTSTSSSRAHPAARAGDGRLRLLRARLQVRAGGRRDPGRPRADGTTDASDRPVRPAPSGDDSAPADGRT